MEQKGKEILLFLCSTAGGTATLSIQRMGVSVAGDGSADISSPSCGRRRWEVVATWDFRNGPPSPLLAPTHPRFRAFFVPHRLLRPSRLKKGLFFFLLLILILRHQSENFKSLIPKSQTFVFLPFFFWLFKLVFPSLFNQVGAVSLWQKQVQFFLQPSLPTRTSTYIQGTNGLLQGKRVVFF